MFIVSPDQLRAPGKYAHSCVYNLFLSGHMESRMVDSHPIV
jgi:hypothetical protein